MPTTERIFKWKRYGRLIGRLIEGIEPFTFLYYPHCKKCLGWVFKRITGHVSFADIHKYIKDWAHLFGPNDHIPGYCPKYGKAVNQPALLKELGGF